jgi:hypothetical protein
MCGNIGFVWAAGSVMSEKKAPETYYCEEDVGLIYMGLIKP